MCASMAKRSLSRLAAQWCRQLAAAEPRLGVLLAHDAEIHGLAPGGEDLRGPAEAEAVLRQLSALYPVRRCKLAEVIVADSRVAVRWALRVEAGRGDWRTRNGEIAGMTMFRVVDDRIVEVWMNFGRWWV